MAEPDGALRRAWEGGGRMRQRFGLNGATTGTADLLTDLRVTREAGFGALEIRDSKLETYLQQGGTLGALRAAFVDAGVRPLSLNALERSTLVRGVERDAVLDRCRTLCGWAEAMGCPYVVAVPSFLPPGGMPEVETRARTVAALRVMASAAAQHEVKVGFEFLGFPTCSVSTLRAARGIVEEVGDPRVGLVIDAFHFYIGGSRPEDLDGLEAAQLFLVHLDDAEPGEPSGLTDAQRLLPGEGIIPLRALISGIEAAGYSGAYSLELFRPEYWAMDPLDLARRGIESMRRLFE